MRWAAPMGQSFKSKVATVMVTAIWAGAVAGIITDGDEDEDTITVSHTLPNNGDFVSVIELDCPNDNEAIESARQFINGHDIELWQEDRKIAKLDRNLD